MPSNKQGRPTLKAEYIDEIKRLYLEQELSLSEISQILPISIQTLSRWLKDDGIELQDRKRNPNANRSAEEQLAINEKIRQSLAVSEKKKQNPGGRKPDPREERVCSCGNKFTVLLKSKQRFCSRSCAQKKSNGKLSLATQAEWYAKDESLCQCGNRIPYEHRHEWRYCSTECRKQFGGKRQPDPENYVTFNCQTCEKEITRYKKYGNGHNKFCSNQCAAKHTKKVRHYLVRDADLVLDSGWEALFAGLMLFVKIQVERTDRSLAVEWQTDHWYAPDFYLPHYGLYVEVKGIEDDDDAPKWDIWREQRGPLLVLEREDLDHLRRLDDLDAYFAARGLQMV